MLGCWRLLVRMASVCIIQCDIISHCRFCKVGYEAGLDEGRQKGLAEGFAAGWQQGCKLGEEVR